VELRGATRHQRSHSRRCASSFLSRSARSFRPAFCASSFRRAISFLNSLTAASEVDRPGPGRLESAIKNSRSSSLRVRPQENARARTLSSGAFALQLSPSRARCRRTLESPLSRPTSRRHPRLLTITHESSSPVLSADSAGEPIAPARDATIVNLASLARDRSARCPGRSARRRGLDGGLSGGPASSAAAGLEIRGQLDGSRFDPRADPAEGRERSRRRRAAPGLGRGSGVS